MSMVEKEKDLKKKARAGEIKMASFLVEHNLPFRSRSFKKFDTTSLPRF